MTWKLEPGKFKCREGEAQVFAVEDGIAWGRVKSIIVARWFSAEWQLDGISANHAKWADILPPAPVKQKFDVVVFEHSDLGPSASVMPEGLRWPILAKGTITEGDGIEGSEVEE